MQPFQNNNLNDVPAIDSVIVYEFEAKLWIKQLIVDALIMFFPFGKYGYCFHSKLMSL